MNIRATALTLALGAFSLGLAPATAEAIPTSPSIFTYQANSAIEVAYVKKKVIVKKKGVKKTTVTIRHRPRGYAYGFYAHRFSGCRTIVRLVRDRHHHLIRVLRRSC